MLGISYPEFMLAYKDKTHQNHKYFKAMRQAAKAANFGFPGGMGAAKLVLAQRKMGLRFCQTMRSDLEPCGSEKVTQWKGRDVTPICKNCVRLADELRFQWLKKWPGMTRYFYHAQHLAETGSAEQFVSRRVRGGLEFSSAANTLFQGLAADGAKFALRQVTRACYDSTQGDFLFARCRPVLFAHDEIVSILAEGSAHLTAPRKARIMIEAMRQYTPDVEIKAEPALMLRWYKDAEPVFDEQGRLIPWEPKS
jgi:DNA polymerase-1